MSAKERTLSTSELRRETVVSCAMKRFAQTGYYGTTVADVAQAAGISPAYVFRLFPTKEELFLAAVRECYATIEKTLLQIPPFSPSRGPDAVLADISALYVRLIEDSTVIQLQIQAQSVATIPSVKRAVQQGLKTFTQVILERSGAAPAAVQQLVAYAQLCHLIVVADLHRLPDPWAATLTEGMVHPEG
jgi:AcrR family transcriptional regulator